MSSCCSGILIFFTFLITVTTIISLFSIERCSFLPDLSNYQIFQTNLVSPKGSKNRDSIDCVFLTTFLVVCRVQKILKFGHNVPNILMNLMFLPSFITRAEF